MNKENMTMIKCPHCGKSHYSEDYHTSTCMGWTPVVKDGVRYDEDPNIHTTHCTCLECGCNFSFDNKGNITKRMSKEEKESYVENISLNDNQEIKDNYSYDYSSFINTDVLKNFMHNITINDNIETLCINYKGKEYKFNLEKVLNLLANVVEEITVTNK